METNRTEYVFPKEQLLIKDKMRKNESYKFENFASLISEEYPKARGSDIVKWIKNLELDGNILRLINEDGISFRTTQYLEEVIGKVEWQARGHAILYLQNESGEKTGETLYLNRKEAALVVNGEVVKAKRIPKEWRGVTTGGDDEGLIVDVISTKPYLTVAQNVGGGRKDWLSAVKLMEPMMKDVVRLSEKHQEVLSKEEVEKVQEEGSFISGYLRRTGKFERWCGLRAFFDVEGYVGKIDEPGIETKLGLAWMNAKEGFTANSMMEAEMSSNISTNEILKDKGRKDLRNIPFVTVDGESTKDFDDAIATIDNKDGTYTMYVAIADVSRYVLPDGYLDKEAKEKSTTLYMPHKAIPMLPEILSNGVCSLNPGQENAVMVCEAKINKDGLVGISQFYPAVISSHARLTYNEVDTYIHKESLDLPNLSPIIEPSVGFDKLKNWDEKTVSTVVNSLSVANILRGYSLSKPFDREPEIEPVLNKKGKVDHLRVVLDATPSNKLVEEFMLFANKEAAKMLSLSGNRSVLYRNQKAPEDELSRPRSAKYENVNTGHYSLGHDSYMHFTSPIRRYPDLMAHRAIKNALGYTNYNLPKDEEVDAIGQYCNEKQRLARGASDKANQWLILQYAEQFKREIEDVKIIREANNGWFVQGEKTNIQAFVLKPKHESEVEKVLEAGIKVEVERVDLHAEKIFLRLKDPEPVYEEKESLKVKM